MSCSTVRGILYNYINAYVDDELSDTDRAAVEKHFEVCAHCANERFEIEQMKNTLHNEFAYSSPYGLEEDIKNKIAQSANPEAESIEEKKPFSWRWLNYIIPPFVTAVAAVLIVLALVPAYQPSVNMEEEIVSAHVRSLIEDNLIHIASSETNEVKPWFNGRVDFVAKAKDLSSGGFNLKGGRLDYLNQRSAASIVYQIRSHAINLFIFPTNEEDLDTPLTFQNKGYNIIKWVNNGLEYCAISDLNMSELKLFAQLFRKENSSKQSRL